VRQELFAVLGRQEAHQVGDVFRTQGGQKVAQPFLVAAIERIGHQGHELGIEGIVLAEREIFEILVALSGRGLRQFGGGEVVRFAAQADLPAADDGSLFPERNPTRGPLKTLRFRRASPGAAGRRRRKMLRRIRRS